MRGDAKEMSHVVQWKIIRKLDRWILLKDEIRVTGGNWKVRFFKFCWPWQVGQRIIDPCLEIALDLNISLKKHTSSTKSKASWLDKCTLLIRHASNMRRQIKCLIFHKDVLWNSKWKASILLRAINVYPSTKPSGLASHFVLYINYELSKFTN